LYFEINKVAVKLNQFWDLGGNLRKNGTLFKNKKKSLFGETLEQMTNLLVSPNSHQ
jgi:hypothetical protein